MGKRLVVAGSRTVPVPQALACAVRELAELPDDSEVFLRKPTKKPASSFEMGVALIAIKLGLNVRWWEPGPGGRQATFLRDVNMVGAADEVLAYFTEDEVMSELSGTAHVVEKALDQGRPCRAYAIVDGTLKWVGGSDQEGQQ